MSENRISGEPRASLSAALLCLAALTAACGSVDPQKAATPQPRPVPGCEQLDVAPCDTLDRACQQSRLELAACLRQTVPGLLPPVTMMTEQAYAEDQAAKFDGTQSSRTGHFETAMNWLGLVQPGAFRMRPGPDSTADSAVSYRWRERDLFIIDHGRPADDAASNIAMVAALIRALRDRDIDIGHWSSEVAISDADSVWGANAMYFGEAQFYSNRYKAALAGLTPSSADEFAQINDSIREDIAWIRAQPSPYVASNTRFAYNFGARAAYLAWQEKNGAEGVNALYDSKLLTHQLMASETEASPPPTLKYHAIPRAPAEWDQDPVVTALGAWGLFLSLSRNLSTDAAWSLALKWSGEQLFVYNGIEPSSDTALVWQLELADETSASSLEEALSAGTPGAQVRRAGTFVTLTLATTQDPLDWAFVTD